MQVILSYLVENPDARDTLEGIVQWWVLQQRIKEGMAEVRMALDKLVDKGWVLTAKGQDSQVHYRVNRQKLDEIALWLKKGDR